MLCIPGEFQAVFHGMGQCLSLPCCTQAGLGKENLWMSPVFAHSHGLSTFFWGVTACRGTKLLVGTVEVEFCQEGKFLQHWGKFRQVKSLRDSTSFLGRWGNCSGQHPGINFWVNYSGNKFWFPFSRAVCRNSDIWISSHFSSALPGFSGHQPQPQGKKKKKFRSLWLEKANFCRRINLFKNVWSKSKFWIKQAINIKTQWIF